MRMCGVAHRGRLRTYVGTAPGVGKTYAMLTEARRQAEAGERVVMGWIERHARAETLAQGRDLEIMPPRTFSYRGTDFVDLDVQAVAARDPHLVLVDELAHTVADGSRRRREDVADLLATGIDVLTTLNVANLISTRDYAARIVGAGPLSRCPMTSSARVRSSSSIFPPKGCGKESLRGGCTRRRSGRRPRRLFPVEQS